MNTKYSRQSCYSHYGSYTTDEALNSYWIPFKLIDALFILQQQIPDKL